MRDLSLTTALEVALALGPAAAPASAEGELFIYTWTDYTAPALVAAFEKETGIEVVIDTYDSNETLLAKLKAGASGYDIIVPTHYLLPVLIEEDLVQEIDATTLSGYDNIERRWRSPSRSRGAWKGAV